MGFVETIQIIRDFVIIAGFLIVIVLVVILYRKITNILNLTGRIFQSVGDLSDAVSENLVEPVKSGTGLIFGVGKLVSFVLSLSGRAKRETKGKGEGGDGQ